MRLLCKLYITLPSYQSEKRFGSRLLEWQQLASYLVVFAGTDHSLYPGAVGAMCACIRALFSGSRRVTCSPLLHRLYHLSITNSVGFDHTLPLRGVWPHAKMQGHVLEKEKSACNSLLTLKQFALESRNRLAMCYIIEGVSKAHRTLQGSDYRAKPTTQQHIPTRNTTSAKRRTAQATTQTLNSPIADPPD
jgi:hypothetical protein